MSYTWTASTRYCDTEAHRTSPTCPDCDTDTQCAGCGGVIAAGQPHRVCRENGEAAHPGCARLAAERWGPDNW